MNLRKINAIISMLIVVLLLDHAGREIKAENLFFDTRWEIRDAEGNQYEGKLTLYSQMVKSIETVNAVLRMTGEEYSRLSGKELEITFYCTQGEDYESYAHGKLAVKLP